MPGTIRFLTERGVRVVHEETSVSIADYDRRAANGHRVTALVHSTC